MELFTGYTFFSALVLLSIPAIILGIKEKNIKYYGFFVTLVFVFLALMKSPKAIMYLVIFCLFEYFIIHEYLRIYKAKGRNAKTYYIFVFLSLLPLMLNKFLPVLPGHLKIFAFLGISYMTFKGTQIIIEIYDGLIEDVKLFDFAYLFLFFPTITSGPIDRSRRFEEDLKRRISKEEYLDNLGTAIFRILLGAMYKTVFAALFYQAMLRLERTSDILELIGYMYVYGFYMFFDFAGIEQWAVGNWKAVTPLAQYYQQTADLMQSFVTVHYHHVKGHTGIEGNEIADLLAKEAAGVQLRKKDIAAIAEFKDRVTQENIEK